MTEIPQQIREISVDNFDYPLPDERIARHPLAQRDGCRLLVHRPDGTITDHVFSEIETILPEDSMLVCNNTRVINARLRFRKGADADGALIEIFCLEPDQPRDYAMNFATIRRCSWICFVGNSKRWKSGKLHLNVNVGDSTVTLSAERIGRADNTSIVEFTWDNPGVTFSQIISAVGEIPIPPYLNRSTEESDTTDYQTVYSHIEGSVAAPTAGLHFTEPLLQRIADRGIPCRQLTLHVGAGTFQPVKSDTIGEHLMHSEFVAVGRDLIKELAKSTRKVIAVGTTSVRTLESLYHIGCLIHEGCWDGEVPQWYPYEPNHPQLTVNEALDEIIRYLDSRGLDTLIGSTRIIIMPGYTYRIVKGMVTNFHQPRSTLLLLVSAFIGDDWQKVYEHALASDYRFLSYGDACLFI